MVAWDIVHIFWLEYLLLQDITEFLEAVFDQDVCYQLIILLSPSNNPPQNHVVHTLTSNWDFPFSTIPGSPTENTTNGKGKKYTGQRKDKEKGLIKEGCLLVFAGGLKSLGDD